MAGINFLGVLKFLGLFLRFKAFLGLVSFFEVLQKIWEIFAETLQGFYESFLFFVSQ